MPITQQGVYQYKAASFRPNPAIASLANQGTTTTQEEEGYLHMVLRKHLIHILVFFVGPHS
jgi:hypothetical protein